ncbi:octanoyltransferase, partial [Bacillus safensis]|nr:octanoyltransferase [Bacillus safensis]
MMKRENRWSPPSSNIDYVKEKGFYMQKEKWCFIDSGNQDPAFNMAMDEALR